MPTTDRNGGNNRPDLTSPALKDQIEYMADLLAELKEMARDQRLTTLAGILELAYAEACLRHQDAA